MKQGRAHPSAQSEAIYDVDFAAAAGALLDRIKIAANKRDVPYQSPIKTWLAERTEKSES